MSEHNGEILVTHSQRYSMLRALRDCEQFSLKRGKWETPVCNLESIAGDAGLDVTMAAKLFRELVTKGYLRWVRLKYYAQACPVAVVVSFTDKGLEYLGVSLELERRLDLLSALRGFRQRSLKHGEWQTVCNLDGLAEVLGLDSLSTADLFSSLADEGYLRGDLIYEEYDPEGNAITLKPEAVSISALTEKGLVAIDELPDPDSKKRGIERAEVRAEEERGIREAEARAEEERRIKEATTNAEKRRKEEEERAEEESRIREAKAREQERSEEAEAREKKRRKEEEERAEKRRNAAAERRERAEARAREVDSAVGDNRFYRLLVQPFVYLAGIADYVAAWLRERAVDSKVKVSEIAEDAKVKVSEIAEDAKVGLREGAEDVAEPAAFTFAPVAAAVAAFVAALIPLAYPTGVIALWVQLSNHFDYGFWKALYAASLARSTVVVGKAGIVLALSFLSALVPMWAWYAYARAKVKDEFRDEDHSKRRKRWVVQFFGWYAAFLAFVVPIAIVEIFRDRIARILSVLPGRLPFWQTLLRDIDWILGLLAGLWSFWLTLLCFALLPMLLRRAYARAEVKDEYRNEDRSKRGRRWVTLLSWGCWILLAFVASMAIAAILTDDITRRLALLTGPWSLWLVLLFVVFTVAQVGFGGGLFFLKGIQEETSAKALNSLYLGLAIVYAGSIAAGVCLAGLQSPSLPTTTLTLRGPEDTVKEYQVGVLSNANSYWYVVKYCGRSSKLVAVPNTNVADIDAIVDEPRAMDKTLPKYPCDAKEPKTTIKRDPPHLDNDNTPKFTFDGDDNLSEPKHLLFSYKWDDKQWHDYQSDNSVELPSLSNGSHTFHVKAKDEAGNVDSSPDRYKWIVDTKEPKTTIRRNPPHLDNDNTPKFTFDGDDKRTEPKHLLFSYKWDDKQWHDYQSDNSVELPSLSNGSHTFHVKAKDEAGNVAGDPAQRTWIVDTKEPKTNIESAPPDPTNDNTPKFTFDGDDNLSEPKDLLFSYKWDDKQWHDYQSDNSVELPSLSNGSHTFHVKAKDEAGNVAGDPAQYTWTIC